MHSLARLIPLVAALIFVFGRTITPAMPASAQSESGVGNEVPRRVFHDLLTAPALGLGKRPHGLLTTDSAQSPESVVLAFVREQRDGLLAADTDLDWAVVASEPLDASVSVVRLVQRKDGLAIAGTGLVVQIEGETVRGVAGAMLPAVAAASTPLLSLDDAEKIARQATPLDLGDAVLVKHELSYFSPQLFEVGLGPTALAYQLVLAAGDGSAGKVVFVDARTGKRLLQYDSNHGGRQRIIRDADGDTTIFAPVCYTEAGPVGTPSDECSAAFAHTDAVYDYFSTTHGRDSYDGAGAPMTAIVRFGYALNAFWDSTFRVAAFGPGFATRDVVAHEWTHAVTQFTAGLIYRNQAGAINEAFSDIFAAMIDRDDWTVGEETPLGVIHDLSAPAVYDQADRVSGYRCRTGDNGGVHSNSGIVNKLAYLMAEGGSFNGRVVSAIGREATERIFYRTLVGGLFPSANFADLHQALLGSAAALYGLASPEYATTLAAAQAVELDQPLPCGNTGVPDVYEVDDRPGQARPIPADGTTQIRSFHVGGDQDWLSFQAEEGTIYSLETLELEPQADTILTLFGPDGATVLAVNDDWTYEDYSSRIRWTATSSGLHFVQATNYYGRGVSGTGYRIRVSIVQPLAPPDAFEIDNTQPLAVPISPDAVPQAHNFHTEGDVDWVRFSAVIGTTYRVETLDLGDDSDTVLALFDQYGVPLAVNDDCEGLASCITWTAPASGTFAVRVWEYGDQAGPQASYRLRVATLQPRVYLPMLRRIGRQTDLMPGSLTEEVPLSHLPSSRQNGHHVPIP